MSDGPDPVLDCLADDVRQQAMTVAATQELLTPLLAVQTGDGSTLRFKIATPGVHPSEAMKVILAATGATHAAICFEGWAVELQAPEGMDEAWKRSALTGTLPAGVPRASRHPDRYDQLTLIGQIRDRPAGYTIHRSWRIEPGSPRTFRYQDDRDGMIHAPSNFWPMFARYEEIRGLIRLHAALAKLRDEIRRG